MGTNAGPDRSSAAQILAGTAVKAGMKPHLAFVCLAFGVISAMLVGPSPPGPRTAAGPDLIGLDDAVTFGPGAQAASLSGWGSLPTLRPDVLLPRDQPPPAIGLGRSDPLARLQATPANYRPLPYAVDRAGAVNRIDTGIKPAEVPEPATWLMLVAGFALVGLGARRRYLATL